MDKKPPVTPSSTSSTTVGKPGVHSSPESVTGLAHPSLDTENIEACPSQIITGCTDKVMKHSMMEQSSEVLKGTPDPTQAASNMKSRLQRLAEQRHYWDSEGELETVSS